MRGPCSTWVERVAAPGLHRESGDYPLSSGVRLVRGDLGLRGKSLARAGAGALRNALSIAEERHVAIHWLRGDHPTYSKVDTPT